jgi:predicted secreted Zn-dependent protease
MRPIACLADAEPNVKQKFKLYGKTQEDIESQLLEWQKKNPVLSSKRHPI